MKDLLSLRFKEQHSAKKVARTLEGLVGSCDSDELAGFGCLAFTQVTWLLVRDYGRDLQPRKM